METVFLKLLNMSAAAGWLILAVMILRLLMRRLPRWLSCLLWAIVAFRLICPFTVESSLSLIPSAQILTPYEIQYAEKPAITSGIPAINSVVNPVFGDAFTPVPGTSVNPLYVWMFMAGILWLLGFILLLGYALISYLHIRRKVREAVPLRDNIWLCDHVSSPFILGIFRPRIYLFSGIAKEEINYVLAHEKAHLTRRDHWWKPLGYLLLSVYWFHPLIWAAYVLFCRDIELACDEKVIKDMNLEGKKAYSHALVSCSINRRLITACPLAFGEGNVKGRVKRVLNYKKPAFWMIAAAGAACAVAAVCFLTDPVKESSPQTDEEKIVYEPDDDAADNLKSDSRKTKDFYRANAQSMNTQPTESPLDKAIYTAIMKQNKSVYLHDYNFACCDFVALETVSATPSAENTAHTITCYGWALYQQYDLSENGIESKGGGHIPVALTFTVDDNGYTLSEYWQPRGGGDFVSDIQKKFPEHIVDDGINSQKFIIRQIQNCYSRTIQSNELDSDAIVLRLLDTLCADKGYSFDPQNNYDRTSTEFRELIYYGDYTIRCFFDRFKRGRENELEGRIMALVCEELLQTRGKLSVNAADAETGQLWYDALIAQMPDMKIYP